MRALERSFWHHQGPIHRNRWLCILYRGALLLYSTASGILYAGQESDSSLNRDPLPLELIILVLHHLKGDTLTLRACSFVCPIWKALAHPLLFREVVTDDFPQLLTTNPAIGQYVRCLTFCGGHQGTDLWDALEQLPQLTELHVWRGSFWFSCELEDPQAAVEDRSMRPRTSPSLQLLSIKECIFDTAISLYKLLTHLGRVDTLVLQDVHFVDIPSESELPPQLHVRVRAIRMHPARDPPQFWPFLRRCFAPVPLQTGIGNADVDDSAGLSLSTSLNTASSIFLEGFSNQNVRSVSINVLRATCSPTHLVLGTIGLDNNTIYNSCPPVPLKDFASTLRKIVLYFTTTSTTTGRSATFLYTRMLKNNWEILKSAPNTLTHIELCFQRFGLHMRYVLNDLRAIHNSVGDMDPEMDPDLDRRDIRWRTIDKGTVKRFPALEAFTCVLCDGGFVDENGPFHDAEVDNEPLPDNIGLRRQREYDDHVELLQGLLWRLDEKGLLRFKMSKW